MERKKYLQVGLLCIALTALCLIIFIIISVITHAYYADYSPGFLLAIEIISLILIVSSILGGVLACLLIALYFIKKL